MSGLNGAISAPVRRFVVIGGALVTIALLAGHALPAWVNLYDTADRLRQSRSQLARTKAKLAAAPNFGLAAAQRVAATARPYVFVASGQAVAASAMEAQVRRVASESGLSIEQLATGMEGVAGPSGTVVIQLTIAGPEAKWPMFLTATNLSRPLLHITHLVIEPRRANGLSDLVAEVTVRGYWLRQETGRP